MLRLEVEHQQSIFNLLQSIYTYLLHHLKIYCMCLNFDSCGESKFVMINDEF